MASEILQETKTIHGFGTWKDRNKARFRTNYRDYTKPKFKDYRSEEPLFKEKLSSHNPLRPMQTQVVRGI